MRRRRVARYLTVVLVSGLATIPALAQKADQTASQFFLAYRAAFDKAKSIDELLPYMAKKNVDQVKATPAEERAKMFAMIKEMGARRTSRSSRKRRTARGPR